MSVSSPLRPPPARTLVLSDVHLSQAHPHDPADPLWMRYRQRAFHPDRDFVDLIDHVLSEPGDLELVFNGDLLDFDTPWVKDGDSSIDEFEVDDAGCAEHALRIAEDHPAWFRATARVLLAGHRVLFLSGNHDVELCFPQVRARLREVLLAHVDALRAEEGAPGTGATREDLAERIRFRAWFHVTEDGIFIEHGSQYDMFNAVRYPMIPLSRERRTIHPVMGKLAFKRIGSRMGYFNPYYEETFYSGFVGYATHFWEFYARSRRHIVRVWAKGALKTVREIWRHRRADDWDAEDAELAHAETGASLEAIRRTRALAIRPADATMIPILRELWLDRVGMATIFGLAVATAALLGWRWGAATAVVLFLLFGAYEIVTPKPDLRTYDQAPPTVRALWDIHGARAICMGHTHRPFGHWDAGRFHGNSGAWCPAFKDRMCTEPVLDRRPVLLLMTDAERIWGGLHWWDGASLRGDDQAATKADRVVEPEVVDYRPSPCRPSPADTGA